MGEENGRGRARCYWFLATVWGLSCLSFIIFLFVHSETTKYLEDHEQLINSTANKSPTGYLVLYPGNKIIFNMSDASNSTKNYTDILKGIIEEYQCGDGLDNCTSNENVTQLCEFDVSALGKACSINNSFGYLERKPCILLRLEKAQLFVPKPYYSPLAWMKTHSKNHIYVNCYGKRRTDSGRLRTYQIWPPEGLPINDFPAVSDLNNSSCTNRPPLVAVQFPDLVTGQTINIYCTVWPVNSNELAASQVAFSIHIH